jgi:hypothetical protein
VAVLTWDNAQPWDSARTWDGFFDDGPPAVLEYGRARGALIAGPAVRSGATTPASRATLGTVTGPRASGGPT